MPEQPRSIIAGAESEQRRRRRRDRRRHRGLRRLPGHHARATQRLLDAVADEIEADKAALVESAVAESHLPEARIAGEVGRTTGQLRMFADVVRRGDHLGVRIDPALPDRAPLPRADIRQRHIPLGPVAVFGASNFPLAFSTAGGDTASALAAGCPVVVKGHPAHPRTGFLVARAVTRAVEKQGLHAGTFSFLLAPEGSTASSSARRWSGTRDIKAVGFTGSRGAGLALVAAAAARPEPIPVYAEMSSINPVVVLPGALAGDVEALAAAYVGSLTLGAGQFCTNPGLLFLPVGEAGDEFLAAAAAAVTRRHRRHHADPRDRRRPTDPVRRACAKPHGVRVVAEGSAAGEDAPAPQLVEAAALAGVTDEVFGASGVVVRYDGDRRPAAAPRVPRRPAHRDRARRRQPTPPTQRGCCRSWS